MDVSDEQLMAFVDGECGAEDAAAIDAALEADPALAARLEAHLRLRDTVSGAFADVLSEPVPERLVQAAAPAGNVIAFPAKRAAPSPGWWAASGGLIAAGLALGIVVGPALQRPPVTGDMMANGALAHALDHQLASVQDGAAVRIGITFRTEGGGVCRTYQTTQQAGLACHEAKGWKVRMATPATAESDGAYRTAASGLPAPVAALAQSLAAGSPLDAAGEAQARDHGWATTR